MGKVILKGIHHPGKSQINKISYEFALVARTTLFKSRILMWATDPIIHPEFAPMHLHKTHERLETFNVMQSICKHYKEGVNYYKTRLLTVNTVDAITNSYFGKIPCDINVKGNAWKTISNIRWSNRDKCVAYNIKITKSAYLEVMMHDHSDMFNDVALYLVVEQ